MLYLMILKYLIINKTTSKMNQYHYGYTLSKIMTAYRPKELMLVIGAESGFYIADW